MLKIRKSGIDSGNMKIAIINRFASQNLGVYPGEKVEIFSTKNSEKRVVADLRITNPTKSNHGIIKLLRDEIALNESTFLELGLKEGEMVEIHPISHLESFEFVKKKWKGERFSAEELDKIVGDITDEKYSEPLITYFLLACMKEDLTDEEIAGLTMAIVKHGDQLKFPEREIIADKHCIGGIPNNRTTPIVISICASAGLTLPNTFTKAITSSAATADVLATYMWVTKSIDEMKDVIDKTGACLVWGGGLNIAPADDIFIQIERPLNIDSEGQMIASILAKKVACGVNHLLLDIPFGKEAKAKNYEDAKRLKKRFERVAKILKLNMTVTITNGEVPIGKRVGCVGEMMDILEILQNREEAPKDLRENALFLAGELLEFTGKAKKHFGFKMAEEILTSGKAYKKFMEIRSVQGEKDLPELGKFTAKIFAKKSGEILDVDNSIIKKINKISGAPFDVGATIILERNFGDKKGKVSVGDLLYEVCTGNETKLKNVLEFISEKGDGFVIE